jgi:hypothetical protein
VATRTWLDTHGYGANRASLVQAMLAQFPGRTLVAKDAATGALVGYAIAQTRSFGPCVAVTSDVTQPLLRQAMTLDYAGPVTWLVAGQSPEAVQLAESVCGAPTRTWRHMRRGESAARACAWSTLFAKASLAVG